MPGSSDPAAAESIPEAGKTERDRRITKASLLINTAEGFTEDVRRNGLGWHDEAKIKRTVEISDYLKLPSIPSPDTVYTNEFVGKVKLTEVEWAKARELAKPFLLD